jgi:hypothetical protein
MAGSQALPQSDNETVMPEVEVKHVKDPGLMPYRDAYDILNRVQKASGGRVELRMRVLSRRQHAPVPGLEVRLFGTRDFGMVKIDSDGTIDFPMNEEAVQDEADLVSNQKKGELEIQANVLPRLNTGVPVTYGEMQATIAAGKKVRSEIVPWIWRLMTPTVGEVALCFTSKGQAVSIASAGKEFTRSADFEMEGKDGAKLYCARFGPSEKAIAADAMIASPGAWESRFVGSWF